MKKSYSPETGLPGSGHVMFELLNEVGIIAQLSRALLESQLQDGLTANHFGVLNHLVRLGDGRTPLQMARAFQMPKTTMTHVLAGLEKRGLISVTPNPEDGRGKLVYLTQAGRELRNQAVASTTPALAGIIPQFGLEEAAAILPALRKLRVLLDEARDT